MFTTGQWEILKFRKKLNISFWKLFFFYLFSREKVFSFGVWRNSCLKIFVNIVPNKQFFENDLKDVNIEFFEKYKLAFENKGLLEKKLPISKEILLIVLMKMNTFSKELLVALSQIKLISKRNMP